MKVAICIPSYRFELHANIAHQMMILGNSVPKGIDVTFIPVHDPSVERVHNRFLELAADQKSEYILIGGADCWAENPSSVWDMLRYTEESQAGAVGAAVMCKGGFCNIQIREGEGVDKVDGGEDPFEVFRIGSGYTCYNVSALRDISKSPFETVYDKDGSYTGCDYTAADRLRDAGCKLYCDPRVKVLHRVAVIYSRADGTYVQEAC